MAEPAGKMKRPRELSRALPKSFWDSSASGSTVHVCTLFSNNGKHEMRIVTSTGNFPMSQIIIDRKSSLFLWTTEISRSQFADECAHLSLSTPPGWLKGLFVKSPEYQTGMPIKIDPRYSILFLFSPKFPDAPVSNVNGVERQLLYFMEGIMRLPKYNSFLPQLILQYPGEEKTTEKKFAYEAINRTVSNAGFEVISPGFAGCIFSVLGVLKFANQPFVELPAASMLLSFVNDEFLIHLEACNLPEFISAVARGAARCLYSSEQVTTVQLQAVFENFLSCERVSCDFLTSALEAVDRVNSVQLITWLGHIARVSTKIALLQTLLEKVDSYFSVFLILQEAPEVLLRSEAEVKAVKGLFDRIKNRGRNSIMVDEVEGILDIVAARTDVLSKLFYQSIIPGLIRMLFDKPKKELIPLYKRLLVTQYDHKIVGHINKLDFIQKLSRVPETSFGVIVNEFELSEKEALAALNKWLSTINVSVSYWRWDSAYAKSGESGSESSRVLKKIEAELSKIVNTILISPLADTAVVFFLSKFPLSSYNVVAISKAVDEATTIRDVFVKHPLVLEKLGEPRTEITVHELLKAREENPPSWTLDCLLTYALGMSQTPSYEKVELDLIHEREIKATWRLLIHGFSTYSQFPIASNLQQLIQQFSLKVLNGQLVIEKILQLSAKAEGELHELCELMAAAFLQQYQISTFADGLKATFIASKEIGSKLSLLSSFCSSALSNSPKRADILEEINQLQTSYKQSLLSEFTLSEVLNQLLATAQKAEPLINSDLYLQGLHRYQSATPVTIETVHTVCSQVFEETISLVTAILNSLQMITMQEVLKTFEHVEDWRKEIDIFGKVLPGCENIMAQLIEGLRYFHSRETLRDNCQHIRNMHEMIHFDDLYVDDAAQNYLDIFDSLSALPLVQVINIHHGLVHILFPGDDQDVGQAAFEVLTELQDRPDLMKLLCELSDERLKHLLECVNDYDESTVTAQLIFELETVWQFYNEIRFGFSCSQLIAEITNLLQTPKFRNIKAQIHTCSFNVRAVVELSLELEKKEEAKRKQIEALNRSSKLIFSETLGVYNVRAVYSDRAKAPLNLAYLLELKDRASLTIHASNSEMDGSGLQILHHFVEFVQEVRKTVDTLTDLYAYGYPIDIAKEREFWCMEGNFDNLKIFEASATTLLQTWKKSIEDAYLRSYPLTFLFGRQFWILEQCFLNQSDTHEVSSLLEYMNIYSRDALLRYEETFNPEQRLHELGTCLNKLPISPAAPLDLKYEISGKALIKGYIGSVLYVAVPPDRVLHALVSVYLHTTHEFPRSHQVLYCTRESLRAELQAFLYRCFTCPEGKIFALVGCEKLSMELQTDFRTCFAKLVGLGVGRGQFSLAIITTEENSLLSEYFQLLKDPKCIRVRDLQLISDEKVLGDIIRQIDSSLYESNTIVVRSEISGAGKSAWIQREATAKKKVVVKFHISGDLDFREICEELLVGVQPDSVLHFLLSHVDAPNILNDLVTHICLLRTLRAGDLAVIFPHSCLIYIEVQNLQPSLPLPFLDYLQQKTIAFDISSLELTEDVRFVCSYLHLYDTNNMTHGDPSEVQVSTEMAVRLLSKYFLDPQVTRGQPVSYLAVHSFIRVLFALLTNMEFSPFTPPMIDYMSTDAAAAGVPQLKQEYDSLRGHIVSSFLQTCEEVTTRCVAQVKSSQRLAVANELVAPALECTLKWDESNHFSMIFLTDGSHVAIYRKQEHVPISVKKLIYIQSHCQTVDGPTLAQHIVNNQYDIPDYSLMTHQTALSFLQTYAKVETNLVFEYSDSDYVMTPDNFLKMNLIYLRAVSKLPVVIMGETGCGKTSLIRFFVQNVLREELLVLNIHAGVTSHVFAKKVQQILERALEQHRLWVFFDEFNTSNCVGQICEMLCERTFRGRALPDNVVLLAACNPFRLRPNQLSTDNVGIKKSARYRSRLTQNLMHVVKPLPESVIEFIWDFGALTENDSLKYIQTMLRCIKCPNYEPLFAILVAASQKHFRTIEDFSSVSLRDVARFTILFRWFEDSLRVRRGLRDSQRFVNACNKHKLENDWSELKDEAFCAGILALCNCYFYRLSQQSARKIYLEMICNESGNKVTIEVVEKVLRLNENDLIARMELPEAIALNQAFRENISCIIHSIFCKIALFICGKPGCSKSLAIQLVFSNLRGEKSVDEYFRTLPELVMVPFQGSESCTSEGIEKVFDRAKRFLTGGTLNLLPVVIFDEIGLAEISKHNPLKILHSLLELENRNVAFVGLSNWRLDASKMNRAMYLARPDPDCNELIFTARSIYQAFKQEGFINAHFELVEVLALAYCQYKNQLAGSNDAEFFGLRDFYCLIKQTSVHLIHTNTTEANEMFHIAKKATERNFGGKVGAAAKIMEIMVGLRPEFEQFSHTPDTPTIELIKENLSDHRARFLMLICKGDVATCAVDKYLSLAHTERRMLVGSHMVEDENGEEYGFRLLSDMILYMEKGTSVNLKDMDHVYSSLYDLFNQNFAFSGDRRYCRVALGAQFNPRCFVHNDFHVIVFMQDDDKKLEQTDAPFLNRFEKHRFDVDELFRPSHREVFKAMEQWLLALTKLSCGRAPLISLNHAFPLYSPEYLKLLVLFLEGDTPGEVVEKCKIELMRMASQEVLLLAHASVLEQTDKDFIFAAWKSFHSQSFLRHISEFALGSMEKRLSLVFTYDSDMLQPEQLTQMSEATCYQHFSSFRREHDVVEDITRFFRGSDQLYVLDFSLSKDGEHLVLVKIIVEKLASEFKDTSKRVCLLVRLMRNIPVDIEVCWFDQWDLRTFSLSSEEYLSDELLSLNLSAVIQKGTFHNFEEGIGRMTLEAYQKIAFRFSDMLESEETINNYIFFISERVGYYPNLVAALLTKLLSLTSTRSWVEEVLCSPECVRKAGNVAEALKVVVELELASVYPSILFSLDRLAAFHSFFTQTESEFIQQLWLRLFGELKCNLKLQNQRQSNTLDFSLFLNFPFVKRDYDLLKTLREELLISEAPENLFLTKFAERSVLSLCSKEMSRSHALEEMYFRDLIRLDLVTQRSRIYHCEDVLVLLHASWSASKATLEEKALVYSQQRSFSLALCELMSALQFLNIDVLPKVIQNLTSLLKAHENSQEEDMVKQVKETLLTIFHESVSSLYRSTVWLEGCTNIQQIAMSLGRLYNWMSSLYAMYDFFIVSFDEIDILSLIFQLLCPTPNGLRAIFEIQQSAASITDISFLYHKDFSQQLITVLQSNCSINETQRFISVYLYKLLVWNELGYMPMISFQINSDNTFWKHCGSLTALRDHCSLRILGGSALHTPTNTTTRLSRAVNVSIRCRF